MTDFWQRDRHQSSALELGGGRVMIVDDDMQVCVLRGTPAQASGLSVLCQHESTGGARAAPGESTEYRILLTDQKMPELSGLELINRLWAAHPDFPVVLMSGYGWGISASALPGVGFLGKPFEIADLEKAVRYALSGD